MKLNPSYWENRYQKGETAWDVGAITTPIKAYIDSLHDKNIKILIPGAGNSYELEYLLNNGFKNTFVADYAATPLENIKKRISNCPESQLLHADFFELTGTYDLIIEQTFFCALEPELRPKYVQKTKSLLNPGGKIVGLLFQFPLTENGPPFGGDIKEYSKLFEADFIIRKLEIAYNSIPERKGKELFIDFTLK
jgi:SAM-dependent methyltransferase